MAKDNEDICPHCQERYNKRTIRDHMRKWRQEAAIMGIPAHFVEGFGARSSTLNEHPSNLATDPNGIQVHDTEGAEPPTHSRSPTPAPSLHDSGPIRRNPPVTIEEWPDPEANPTQADNDGLQIPPEDAERDPDDLYACPHDPDDRSEAARQFADLSDPEFLAFLNKDVGDLPDEEIQAIFKQALLAEDIDTIKMLASKLRAHFSKDTNEDLR
ncbi:hypothetical protein FRC10_000952 [Ceratobasidium sp. 414]|nr:hypothetical protein FRC10_000952 [Ceratobasidium sp. 414]